ncbi:MAG: PEPxxWA-CTERM sorting domain-containing protein [Sphingomonadales bacterium]
MVSTVTKALLGATLSLAVAAPASASTLLIINDSANRLVSYNTVTNAFTDIGALGTDPSFGDLAYDGTNLWMVGGRSNNALYKVNTTTGAATLVGSHGVTDLFGLAYNSANDTLYATQFSGGTGVYTLNKTTGAATLLTNGGPGIGGLTYRADTNQIVGTQDGQGDFYTINAATGAKTLLNGGSGSTNDDDLAFDASTNSYWLGDYSGNLYQYNATTFSRTLVANSGFSMDGLVVLGATNGAVPEPATWAMMIGGFGAIGGAARYRRRKVAVSFA